MHALSRDEKGIPYNNQEVKEVVWQIGMRSEGVSLMSEDVEFRLSAMLVDEYATMINISRELAEEKDSSSIEVCNNGGEIASVVQQKKRL